MIDYATLCTAIEDWKSGRQPSAVTPTAPRRIATPAHEVEEEAVEYSAVYDTNDAPPEQAPDSTVVYQLSEYEEAEAEADADADADEVDPDLTDDER